MYISLLTNLLSLKFSLSLPEGNPWRVVEFLHVKPGKGAAFVRSKLKNYMNGNVVERTFRAGEPVELATVEKRCVSHFIYVCIYI